MTLNKSILLAILAAVLYAISTPISKVLLNTLSPVYIAALLYLGAGIGMGFIALIRKRLGKSNYQPFTKDEMPSILGMVILDVLAPILLMIGLKTSLPENVALLNNFEIVATSLFAFFIFKEMIPKRLRLAIVFVTLASLMLSFEDLDAFKFSIGSLFVILASISWGLENNLTRKLSVNDPLMVVVIKGLFSGLGSLLIALFLHEIEFNLLYILLTLLLGFVAYGLSIFFYVTAQRDLGAAKTSAFYAFAPFVGAILSLVLFLELPKYNFYIALVLMAVGSYLAATQGKVKPYKE
jgi:drug/metabolite transporter (DMT)-like permease